MSAILKCAVLATLIAAVAAPIAASAKDTRASASVATLHRLKAKVPADSFGAAFGAAPTRQVMSPDGRALGTDPDLNVRFELGRDWTRGR